MVTSITLRKPKFVEPTGFKNALRSIAKGGTIHRDKLLEHRNYGRLSVFDKKLYNLHH